MTEIGLIRTVVNRKHTSAQIYLVQCNEFYKVGVCKDINKRLKSIQTDNPYTITVTMLWDSSDAFITEQRLHSILNRWNHRGEWFVLPQSIVNHLKTIENIDSFASKWGYIEMKKFIDSL